LLNDKSILVTGATGSFGNHFAKTVLERYRPRRLIVFSRDEFKQADMQQRLSSPALRYFLGDVRDRERLRQAMHDVDIVIHAAALKQVPAAEYNPMECVKTNVHGAENVIAAAIETEVEKVVALSTDKAVNPINLYGATKLLSDKFFVAGNNLTGGHRTRFSVVRYGNVVASRGSVIPLYLKLIADGARELPITDSRMTRFWITIGQGVDFVLKALERMQGGEIFVPKIPSARVTDIAQAVAPGMKTKIVGIRPGEKLHEVMCPADDSHLTLEFPDHYVLCPAIQLTRQIDYRHNAAAEVGKPVADGFEYNSATNPRFLSVDELTRMMIAETRDERLRGG